MFLFILLLCGSDAIVLRSAVSIETHPQTQTQVHPQKSTRARGICVFIRIVIIAVACIQNAGAGGKCTMPVSRTKFYCQVQLVSSVLGVCCCSWFWFCLLLLLLCCYCWCCRGTVALAKFAARTPIVVANCSWQSSRIQNRAG